MVQNGPQAGQAFALRDGVNSVGRDPGNDVLLTESSVSRSHARIVVQPDGVWIEDLGSTSGTFVNGQRITGSTWLRAGDVVQLGGVVTLGVQIVPVAPSVYPAAPPLTAAPTVAPPYAAAVQTCSRCGAQNRPGASYCEHCAAPLVAGATPMPVQRPKRKRRALLVGSLVGVSALVVLALVGIVYVRPLLGGGLRLPNVGDWSTMSKDEAIAIGVSVIEQEYPDLADVTPAVTEAQAQDHRIYNVFFSPSIDANERGLARTVIVTIDTDSETISVFESD